MKKQILSKNWTIACTMWPSFEHDYPEKSQPCKTLQHLRTQLLPLKVWNRLSVSAVVTPNSVKIVDNTLSLTEHLCTKHCTIYCQISLVQCTHPCIKFLFIDKKHCTPYCIGQCTEKVEKKESLYKKVISLYRKILYSES